MKDYDQSVAACQKAADVGSENRADYKTVAKAYGRIAKAYSQKKDYDSAIRFFDKALTNHRFKDYLTGKQGCEKELKEQKRQEYIDPQLAEEAKLRGNAAVKAAQYPEAIQEYSEALLRNPDDDMFCSRVYSNRSLCYTKLVEIPHALKDAEAVIKCDPTFAKGYLKRGNALLTLKRENEAIESFNEALKLEAGNAEAREGLNKAKQQKFGNQANMTDQERIASAMKDPEVQQIMSDPAMKMILEQMQTDPQAAQAHMANPQVAAKIMKLIDAGILRTG